MSPNLVRSQLDLEEISPDLAHFGLKSTILAGFSTMDGFNQTDRVSGAKPTTPIRLFLQLAAGQNVFHLSLVGWSRFGHKPDLD